MKTNRVLLVGASMLALPCVAGAQDNAAPPAPAAVEAAVDPASIPMPTLAFTPNAGDTGDFDKYFYFNRAETDFATAYDDIRECDNLARGLPRRAAPGMPDYMMYQPQYQTMAGAVGGALGAAIVAGIAEASAAAERRRVRRSIMRTCMRFKGYQAYGLRKSLWEEFNFEEGSRRVPEAERLRMLRMQARVASGPRPTVAELRP